MAHPRPKKAVDLAAALAWLEKNGSRKGVEDQRRFGIEAPRAFGVGVGRIKAYGREIGIDHDLAAKLWRTGWYEARMLAAFVDDPALVTSTQMDAWASDFDNWGIVDTACFHLFDRTKTAWSMVPRWAKAKPEFRKRAAFALLWSLSVHDKTAPDASFLKGLTFIEQGAADDRHFVMKAVNMALRAIGKRNAALHAAAIATARRLAAAEAAAPRWVGKDALRELERVKPRR